MPNQLREIISIKPELFYAIDSIINNNLTQLSLSELRSNHFERLCSPHSDYYRGLLEKRELPGMIDILEQHGNIANWLKWAEGKNIDVQFPGDGYDAPKSYFRRVEFGEIKSDTFGGCITEAPYKRKFRNSDGTFYIERNFTWNSHPDSGSQNSHNYDSLKKSSVLLKSFFETAQGRASVSETQTKEVDADQCARYV